MRLLPFAAGIFTWTGGVRCVITGGVTAHRSHNSRPNILLEFQSTLSFPHFYAILVSLRQRFNTVQIFGLNSRKTNKNYENSTTNFPATPTVANERPVLLKRTAPTAKNEASEIKMEVKCNKFISLLCLMRRARAWCCPITEWAMQLNKKRKKELNTMHQLMSY